MFRKEFSEVSRTEGHFAEHLALRHLHVSKKFQYVYIDTPKVGCSTIKRTLQNAENDGQQISAASLEGAFGYSHYLLDIHDTTKSALYRPKTLAEMHAVIRSTAHVFAFVRNPFTRILSAYIDKIATNRDRRAAFAQELGWAAEHIERVPSFVDFLQTLAELPAHEMDQHWRPQHYHLSGVPRFSFIGAFERFSSDLQIILGRIHPELPRRIITVTEHRTDVNERMALHFADQRAIELVRRIYANDFTWLGYSLSIQDALCPPRELEHARLLAPRHPSESLPVD